MKHYVHTIDVIFALVLFCVFAMSLLLVLLTGAKAYRGIRDNMEDQYIDRTCVSYISAKIRHYDEKGMVEVGDLDGVPALCMTEDIAGSEYVTYLYFHDGYVCELFTDPILGLTAEDGTGIIEAGGLDFVQQSDDLIKITCEGIDGNVTDFYISLRSEGRLAS